MFNIREESVFFSATGDWIGPIYGQTDDIFEKFSFNDRGAIRG
jgi:hypothetical protein